MSDMIPTGLLKRAAVACPPSPVDAAGEDHMSNDILNPAHPPPPDCSPPEALHIPATVHEVPFDPRIRRTALALESEISMPPAPSNKTACGEKREMDVPGPPSMLTGPTTVTMHWAAACQGTREVAREATAIAQRKNNAEVVLRRIVRTRYTAEEIATSQTSAHRYTVCSRSVAR